MFFLDRIYQKKISLVQEKIPVFGVFLLFFVMFVSSLLFFSSPVSAATPPSIITYQGKLLDDGTAVNATTSIQLRIYDDIVAGNFLYTASGTTGAPLDLSVPVDNGIFSVNMGGSGTNALSNLILANNATLYLEVWIEGNQMSPRKRLTATPYALNSAYLMGYGAATVSTTTYIPVSDASGNFNFSGSIIATGTATSSFTNVLINDGITLGGEKRTTWPAGGGDVIASTTNNFTGTNTFYSVVDIRGKIATPTAVGNIDFGAGGGIFSDVFVSTNYAYIANGDDGLRIVDISDPANPVAVGHENSSPFDARKVVVVGNYAYVGYDDGLVAIDISDPTNPQVLGSGGVGGGVDISIAGGYAYTVDGNSLISIDISDPNDLRVQDTLGLGTGNLNFLDVSGKFAYVSDSNDGLYIVDISDSFNLIQVGHLDNGSNYEIVVNGRYAYIADTSLFVDVIDIIDVSDPTNPLYVSTFGLDAAEDGKNFFISGNHLFVAAGTLDLGILDITSSTNPVRVSTNEFLIGGTGESVFVHGNYVYVVAVDFGDGELNIIDITGAKISNANVGALKVGNIDATGVTQFQQSVYVRGGLNVGNSGLLLNGDFSMMTATNSVSATNTLRFTNTTLFETSAVVTDTHAFIFNTSNSFSNASTTYLFSVRNNGTAAFSIAGNGNVHATGSYYGVSANLGTPGAPGDLAERVDIAQDDVVEAGDVVVVDPNSTDTYRRSNSPYSQEVSGVISTNPTIVVGNGRTEHTAVMAMVGRVPIKVSDENGPIVRGDLLITASSTGHAMRYDPTKDVGGKIAGIVGVALESLPAGKGKIMGLVRTGWVNGQDQQIFSEMRNEISKLSLGQTINNELNISENNDGSISRIQNDVDLNGFSLLSVKSIEGFNGKWQIDEEGRFTTKVETTDGSKTLYTLQTGESQYVFSGNGQLENGKIRIEFDQTIQDIVDTEKPMSINLTLTQKAKGLYVSERDTTGFVVEEIEGGTSNATFDWLIFATRKNGDEVIDEDEPEEQGELVVQDPEQNPAEENIEGGQTEVDLEAENGEENANDDVLEVPLENEGQDNTPDNIAPDPLEEAEPQPVEGEAEEPVVEVLEPELAVEESNL